MIRACVGREGKRQEETPFEKKTVGLSIVCAAVKMPALELDCLGHHPGSFL